MKCSLIAAVAENGVIGRDNNLPWQLPADLKRFKRLTMGFPIIMGRNTWESIGRPLPGRRNMVISSKLESGPDREVFPSLEEALMACAGAERVFVIGGAALYEEALPLADDLYITAVQGKPDGNVYFPEWKMEDWHLVSEECFTSDEEHAYGYCFRHYHRA